MWKRLKQKHKIQSLPIFGDANPFLTVVDFMDPSYLTSLVSFT